VDLSVLKVKDFKLTADANGEYTFSLPVSKKNVTFKFLSNTQEKELQLIKETSGTNVAPVNTKRLEMMIKSVDGQRDQMAIINLFKIYQLKIL